MKRWRGKWCGEQWCDDGTSTISGESEMNGVEEKGHMQLYSGQRIPVG